jgi:hypothetical protein
MVLKSPLVIANLLSALLYVIPFAFIGCGPFVSAHHPPFELSPPAFRAFPSIDPLGLYTVHVLLSAAPLLKSPWSAVIPVGGYPVSAVSTEDSPRQIVEGVAFGLVGASDCIHCKGIMFEYTGILHAPLTIFALYKVVWLRFEIVKEFPVPLPGTVSHEEPLVSSCQVMVPVAPLIVNVALLDGWVAVISHSMVGFIVLEEPVTAIVPATGVASVITVIVVVTGPLQPCAVAVTVDAPVQPAA